MDRATLRHGFVLYGPLLMLGIIQAFYSIVYAWLGAVPPEAASSILGFSVALYVVYWIIADARQRHCVPCFDFGFLLAVFLPVSLVWYAFWTRGWKGFLLLLAFAGLIYGPTLCATIVWLVVHGGA